MSEIEEYICTAEEKLEAAKVLLDRGLYNDAISRGYRGLRKSNGRHGRGPVLEGRGQDGEG